MSYEHKHIKTISTEDGQIFEVLNLPRDLKDQNPRVFSRIPFRSDEKKYVIKGLRSSLQRSPHQLKRGGYVLIVPMENGSVTPVNVCLGCLHNQIVKNTGNHPKNASEKDMAKALLEVAQRYIDDPNRNPSNHEHLE